MKTYKLIFKCFGQNLKRVKFHAYYEMSPQVTSRLSAYALCVGNVISLRGNVVGYRAGLNAWEIKVSNASPQVFCDDWLTSVQR